MITRRRFVGSTLASLAGAIAMPHVLNAATPSARRNVLFIGVDDLNDWVGFLAGHPQVQTPNLDRLAARGVVFANAHCAAPICTPARTALLTGRHPTTSGLHFLTPLFRDTQTLRDVVTLPQHFLENGYHTCSVGKVFHGRNDQASFPEYGGMPGTYGPLPAQRLNWHQGNRLWDWGVFPDRDEDLPDHKIADWAIQQLSQQHEKPFFLAAGFFRPHVPLFVPQRWFDLYPVGKTALPEVREGDLEGISDYARKLTAASVAPRFDDVLNAGEWEHMVRAYLASISFVDAQIGRVLDALEAGPHADSTFIVLWADHGFHLGEKRRFEKRSLWEESTRVPLIIAGPGIQPGRCERAVGTLDLYPTLAELCELPARDGLDGHSLVPLLCDPATSWPHVAMTSFGPGNHAIRSDRWRYIHYADGSQELYDHAADPAERRNLAADPAHADVLAAHRRHLPQREAPLLPGSAGADSPIYPPLAD
jgi:choline-sulfatase